MAASVLGVLVLLVPALGLHLFAGVEQTYLISQSSTLKQMYACKDQCFSLNSTIPRPMKYHRIVYIGQQGNRAYLQGHCYIDTSPPGAPQHWVQWRQVDPEILGNRDQMGKWQWFRDWCESPVGEMREELRVGLGITRVHSEYEMYSNGSFVNLGDQRDVAAMLRGLQGVH